jgi:hypothetical protein
MTIDMKEYLLVEPVAKSQYPPLGLLKISSMLKDNDKGCRVYSQVGKGTPKNLKNPRQIYISSLFTWDYKYLCDCINFYSRKYPFSKIIVGGIGVSLMDNAEFPYKNVTVHKGLFMDAEFYPPDYSHTFGRKLNASISFTTRGCKRRCSFCSVDTLEPTFFAREGWERDIDPGLKFITLWDNNFLQSPNFEKDCKTLARFNKIVDFNQGIDSRLYDEEKSKLLSKVRIDPIRFAFDNIEYEKALLKAIYIAKKNTNAEIRVYVLFNYDDSPEDLYYRLNLLNREGVLSFPMRYRCPVETNATIPGKKWNTYLLRAFNLSLLFYYKKGLIKKDRTAFLNIYGKSEKEFIEKLYSIYEYDKSIKREKKKRSA